ncbi:threonylcarbamoyladenosine tRNA methylthiotransferase [Plakobranchus ocellatus]|uniref:tRNA-t(6)A37 methylthiotransferase n=1 Tax=Plakobranchus ocellatus TaxID=259542 RepID=A0AAV3YYA1_9GAST|nr:threonylcarbamoyladenosine tRNA methylthiotransferase [Plakobranchus ocellatus]
MPSHHLITSPCDNSIGDIEDIVSDSFSLLDQQRLGNKPHVVPRARKGKTAFTKSLQQTVLNDKGVLAKEILSDQEHINGSAQRDSYVPGTQKIYVRTWGCSHNNSDSEYMAGQLAAYGFKITDEKDEADLWLLNSCTVKNPAEDHFKNSIKEAKSKGKSLVLAGCVPQGQQKSDYIQGLSVIGVQQIDRVVEVVEETLKGNSVQLFGQKKTSGKKAGGADLSLPKIRKNPLIEIIAINTGCLNQCTYCKTKHARGDLGSYHPDDIVSRARQSFDEGVVELWLTSEDLGAYGHDIGVTLPQLLWKLVEVIPEGAMMRLGMTNPPYILEHLEEVAKILSHPRVYSFLHVPVQSGSDSVLMDMKREYCVADFKHVVDFLREKVPDVNVATDLICGFPTETEEDFQGSLALVQQYKFASLFINQFFPRPGTPAFRMQRIPGNEVSQQDIQPLGLRRGEQTVYAQERYLRTGEGAPLNTMVEDFAMQQRRIKKPSVLSVALDLSRKYSMPTDRAPLPVPSWPPEMAPTPPVTSLYIRPMGRKDETWPLAMRALALETIARFGRECVIVYTDGSSTGGTGNGGYGIYFL